MNMEDMCGSCSTNKKTRIHAIFLFIALKERGHFETRLRSDENNKMSLKGIEPEVVDRVRLEQDRNQCCVL
jgi:hypothetical protein